MNSSKNTIVQKPSLVLREQVVVNNKSELPSNVGWGITIIKNSSEYPIKQVVQNNKSYHPSSSGWGRKPYDLIQQRFGNIIPSCAGGWDNPISVCHSSKNSST